VSSVARGRSSPPSSSAGAPGACPGPRAPAR
jgi:hypothetical protein